MSILGWSSYDYEKKIKPERMSQFTHLSEPWQQCIEDFLQCNPSASSRQRFRSTLSCFVRELGDTPIDEVTVKDIEAFVVTTSRHRNHGNPSTHNTQRRRFHIINAFYAYANTYLVDGKPLYHSTLPVSPAQPDSPKNAAPFSTLPDVWRQCLESFLNSIEAHSGSAQSRQAYECVLRMFFAEKSPEHITRSDVLSFLSRKSKSRRNAGADISPATRNNSLMAINSFYAYASNFEVDSQPLMVSRSPSYGIPYVRVGAQYRSMTTGELERVLACIPSDTERGSRDKALILFYWFSGKRRAELQRLTWGDLEYGTVIDSDGTRRPGVTFAFRSKGRSREIQHAECPSPVVYLIERYLQISGRAATIQPGDPLFTSSRQGKGKAPLSKDYINKMWKEWCAKSGLDSSSISIHTLRHSAAKTRFTSGQDIISLKNWLGHSDLGTTWRYVQQLQGTADTFALQLEKQFAFLTPR